MRVLLLTQYYAPEPVDKFTDLARGLRERGHQVEVITGFPCYPHGRTYDGYRQSWSRIEFIEGTRVIRVPQFADHSRSVVRRVLYYMSFALSTATIGLMRSGRADVMLVYQSALPTGLAAWAISRAKRIPYVLDVADLWPESVAASGMIRNRLALWLIARVVKFVYARAAAIHVITEGYRANLSALGAPPEKVRVIHSWPAATHLIAKDAPNRREETRRGAQINILYAGTIGPCQQLEIVISAALHLLSDKRIQFTVVGDGLERASLERRAVAARADNIRFLGWRSPAETAELMANANLLLVHLKPDAMSRLSIPSKTFAYMAAGRPLLMAVEGEAAELIEKHQCGITAAPADASALAEAVRGFAELSVEEREKMGRAARAAFDRCFSPGVLIDQVTESLGSIAAGKRLHFYDRYVKRAVDLSLSVVGLVFLSPLLAIVALVVRFGLGSPVLFRQPRAGRHGKTFQLIKFRTMSDRRSASGELLSDAERLNWLGRLLRSTSLDELPQLWNVLRGKMSLVGPRPLLVDYLAHYTPEQARRHDVRPGLSGLAQVRGRNQLSWRRRLRYDSWYAQRPSLKLDLKIMWETMKVLLLRRGISAKGHATMPRFDESPASAFANEIYVVGAGGHGKVAVRAADLAGLKVAGVFDDDRSKHGMSLFGAKVLGAASSIKVHRRRATLLAIGENEVRRRLATELDLSWATVIHPRSCVDASAVIGEGSLVLAGAVVQADAAIGKHAIVNDNATIEHDCRLGDWVHVACGACLAGGVTVGDGALIGAGATLLPGVSVGEWAVVGAGAVVLKHIPAGSTAVGVPARLIHKPSSNPISKAA